MKISKKDAKFCLAALRFVFSSLEGTAMVRKEWRGVEPTVTKLELGLFTKKQRARARKMAKAIVASQR